MIFSCVYIKKNISKHAPNLQQLWGTSKIKSYIYLKKPNSIENLVNKIIVENFQT